jgi:hypothetical protein
LDVQRLLTVGDLAHALSKRPELDVQRLLAGSDVVQTPGDVVQALDKRLPQ